MTVSFAFFVRTKLENRELEGTLAKFWHGPAYEVSVLEDQGYQACFLERYYGDPCERDMVRKALSALATVTDDAEILYSRCDDPYFLDSPVHPKVLGVEDLFAAEFEPAYHDGPQYFFRLRLRPGPP